MVLSVGADNCYHDAELHELKRGSLPLRSSIAICKSCEQEREMQPYQKNKGGKVYFRKLCKSCWSDARLPYRVQYQLDNAGSLAAAQKLKHERNKEQRNTAAKRHYYKLKEIVFNGYGAKCACCEEDNLGFLTLDHKNDDGADHRRKIGMGHIFYRWIIDHNFPSSIQVLCYNCNAGRYHNGGVCPHETSRLNYTKPSDRYQTSNWIM